MRCVGVGSVICCDIGGVAVDVDGDGVVVVIVCDAVYVVVGGCVHGDCYYVDDGAVDYVGYDVDVVVEVAGSVSCVYNCECALVIILVVVDYVYHDDVHVVDGVGYGQHMSMVMLFVFVCVVVLMLLYVVLM